MATKAQSAEGPATTESGGDGVRRRDFLNVAAVMFRAALLGRREHHPEGATAVVLD